MTIVREIDGKEMSFDLTPHELYCAFEEQEHLWDVASIRDYVCSFDNEDYMDVWGVTKAQYEALVEDMAYCMRRYVNKYDMSEDYARDEAIKDTIAKNY